MLFNHHHLPIRNSRSGYEKEVNQDSRASEFQSHNSNSGPYFSKFYTMNNSVQLNVSLRESNSNWRQWLRRFQCFPAVFSTFLLSYSVREWAY